MRYFVIVFMAIAIALTALPVTAQDSVYVSLNGNFRVDIPEGWVQISPNLVDLFLRRNKAGGPVLDYDAVFAPKTSVSFHEGAYCIVTVDKNGEFSEQAIDSVLKSVGSTFGKGIRYFPVADFVADLKSNEPSYDKEAKIISVINNIYDAGNLTKRNMLVWKFYEHGMANFYFYAPDSLFEQSKTVFHSMLSSFSIEDIESYLPQEKLKLADIDVSEQSEQIDDDESSTWMLYTGIIIVLILIIAKKRRKKQ